MATTSDVNRARDDGHERGFAEAIARTRAFTGVDPFVPDLDQPEHLAYPAYLEKLTNARQVARDRAERALRDIQELEELIAQAEDEEAAQLDQRREERAARNPLSRLGGRVADLSLPISKRIRTLKKDLTKQHEWHDLNLDRFDRFGAEEAKVLQWVDEYLAAADLTRRVRAERAENERLDQERSMLDVTPRWAQVFRREDFIAADPRRAGGSPYSAPGNDLAGVDFGHEWQRDESGPHPFVSRWVLRYILETKETFLEAHPRTPDSVIWLLGTEIETLDDAMDLFMDLEKRQDERNSIAVVLDTYEQHRTVKARF